jgi:hypothetical protein
MPIVGQESMTLTDWGKRLGPNHQIADIVEILAQQNPVLLDALWKEANNITSHRTTIRAGLPEVYWRLLNRGVPTSKSRTVQIDDAIGMLEARSKVDKDLAELNGMKASFMLSEATAFLEAMNQEMASTIFYGNLKSNSAAFTGLAVRYSTLNRLLAECAQNVIDAGGTGNLLTSIWLILWSDQTAHMLFPKGLPSGLQKEDKPGVVTLRDADGYEFDGYESVYKWKAGLCVRDWRSVVRIANIDTQGLEELIENGAATVQAQKLVRLMIQAYNRVPNILRGRSVWYMGRTAKTMLDLMAAEKSNVNLTIREFEGQEVTSFKGIPIRQVDALLETEDQVTG